MPTRLDRQIIKFFTKHQNRPVGRFAATKAGFLIGTFFIMCQSVLELKDAIEEGRIILPIVFAGIIILLGIITLRHLLWKKRVEHFEYWLKLVEGAVVLYTGIDRWHYLAGISGYGNQKGIILIILTIMMTLLYCAQSRLFYLKNKGLLTGGHPAVK